MELLSTREVAAWLGVSEATVKRWSDAGMITCIRTPGGHRKFRKSDVRKVVEGSGDAEHAHAGAEREHQPTLMDGFLLRGDIAAAAALMQSQGLAAEALAHVCDTIFAPSLAEIGRKWAIGEMSIAEEHVASNVVLEAVAQTLSRLPAPPPRAPLILLACVGTEQHDIGLRMARLVAHANGFATLLLGGSVPVADLMMLLNRSKPTVIGLSASPAMNQDEVRGHLGVLSSATRTLGVKLIVGGAGFRAIEELPQGVERFASLTEFLRSSRSQLTRNARHPS
jgi:MerR family transcriptional regulator, light-induced transcriptional regulator